MGQETLTYRADRGLPDISDAAALAAARMGGLPRYGKVPQQTRVRWLSKEIIALGRLRHSAVSAEDAIIDAAALDTMMVRDPLLADLTQPEITEAFRDGLFGLYGEFYGVTAMSLYGFLLSFLGTDKKRDAAAMVRRAREREREERNRLEREEERRRTLAEMEEAKRNGTFRPTGRAWYRPEEAAGTDSAAHREKVRRQAEEITEKERQRKQDKEHGTEQGDAHRERG